ncbi:MAG: LysM peptidoglycan-binding domain-containing protein, partial [Anaerolineae bacterium]
MKKHLTGVVLTLFLILLGSAPVLAQGGTVHWVQWGDNLASIAARYGVTPQAIMSANGLANPDLIYVGQKLDIPSGGSMSGGSYYTVKPGDTLGNIARQLNTTVAALANANNLSNADTIFVGQVLNVPGGSVAGPDGGYAPVYKCEYYYTVKWGDTLSAIAWYHGLSVNALLQANNLYGDVIFEGQKLCLPGAQKRPVVTAFYHTVQSGDTVTGIAYRYGVSQAAIIQANNLSEAGLIYVGQTLVIPGYRPSAPTPKAKDVPPPPDYVAVEQQSQPEWDGTVTVVKANNQWWGAQTAESPDPNGITTIVVRIVGDDNIP